MTPYEQDRAIRLAQAEERLERDILLQRERLADPIALGLAAMCRILQTAYGAMRAYVGPLGDLHEIEMASEGDLITVTAPQQGYTVWIDVLGSNDWLTWLAFDWGSSLLQQRSQPLSQAEEVLA